jgi:hypothetical protein
MIHFEGGDSDSVRVEEDTVADIFGLEGRTGGARPFIDRPNADILGECLGKVGHHLRGPVWSPDWQRNTPSRIDEPAREEEIGKPDNVV